MSSSVIDIASIVWRGEDVEIGDERTENNGKQEEQHEVHAYRITVFGKLLRDGSDGNPVKSVCVHVWYRPYFYVEIGKRASSEQIKSFLNDLRRGLGRNLRGEFEGGMCVIARNFVGTSPPTGFLKLVFKSQRALRRADYWLRDHRPNIRRYETRADQVVSLLHDRKIWSPCCVNRLDSTVLSIDISLRDPEAIEDDETICDEEFIVNPEAISQSSRSIEVARNKETVLASFDIECFSCTDQFPNPAKKENVIIAICTTFSKRGSPCYRKVALALGTVQKKTDENGVPEGDRDLELECFDRESALLGRWAQLLAEERTDVITGYNIWGFDMRYVYQRIIVNGGIMNPDLTTFSRDISRIKNAHLELWKGKVKSGGGQVVDACTIKTDGILQVDLMYYLKRFHPRLDCYKLDYVARKLLSPEKGACPDAACPGHGNGKTGLTIPEMQSIWRRGSPEDKWSIMVYCAQDATLVSRLMESLTVLDNVFEMANVCTVPASCVLMQGEQAKVYSLIQREAHSQAMLCPSSHNNNNDNDNSQCRGQVKGREREGESKGEREGEEEEDDDVMREHTTTEQKHRLQGATVLEPVQGAYWDPVVCMDFQSLYPSIMMAHNLCHSTLVTDTDSCRDDSSDLHGGAITVIENQGKKIRFLKRSSRRGVLPKLLAELQTKRNEAKAAAADPSASCELRTMMNAKQQAYKICMNSVYGFCGVGGSAGMLPCIEVATAVTSIGRDMIMRSRDFVQSAYPGSVVIYGDTDSLMVDFSRYQPFVDISSVATVTPSDRISKCREIGAQAASRITELFDHPIKLCFEKCYMPYLLFSKKRYIGREPDRDGKGGTIECKGVQIVRRDTCAFVKRVSNDVLEKLLFDMDIENAKMVVKNAVRELLLRRCERDARRAVAFTRERMEEFVISKTIRHSAADIMCDMEKKCRKCNSPPGACVEHENGNELRCGACGHSRKVTYKNMSSPAIQVACNLEQLRPGQGPKAGDNVNFVYVESYSKDTNDTNGNKRRKITLCSEMAEDPDIAFEKNLTLDARIYLDHQLKNVMVEVFSVLSKNKDVGDVDVHDIDVKGKRMSEVELKRRTEKMLFGDILHEYEATKSNQRLISHYW